VLHSAYTEEEEEEEENNGTVHQLFIDFKKACHSLKREVL
jgi:hypothetical protein